MFQCRKCKAVSDKKAGQCKQCGRWNSIVHRSDIVKRIAKISDINLDIEYMQTGIEELDNCLDGGIVNGSVYMISGQPGTGKSTVLAQIASVYANQDEEVYYFAGEEPEGAIINRIRRLGLSEEIYISTENDIENILKAVCIDRPKAFIIDSYQSLSIEEGSIKTHFQALHTICHEIDITAFIVCQVNKDGDMAGPKAIEHAVDCVCMFDGDRNSEIRLLTSIKNRNGRTPRTGMFKMTAEGLISHNQYTFFSDGQDKPGKAIGLVNLGNKIIACEIQCIATPCKGPRGTIKVTGYDKAHVEKVLLAGGYKQWDCFFNIVGGFEINDTAIDAGILAAFLSAKNNIPNGKKCFSGEIGLLGEVYKASQEDMRKELAQKLELIYENPKSISTLEAIYK